MNIQPLTQQKNNYTCYTCYACCTCRNIPHINLQSNDKIFFGKSNNKEMPQAMEHLMGSDWCSDCAKFAKMAYPKESVEELPEGFELLQEKLPNIPTKRSKGYIPFKVFVNKKKKCCVIAYSGTYNGSELLKNIGERCFKVPRKHFQTALNIYDQVAKKFPESKYDIVTIGHSAGGGLSQYVAAMRGNKAINFAPAGIAGPIANELGLTTDRDFNNIINLSSRKDGVTYGICKNIGQDYINDKISRHSLTKYIQSKFCEFSKITDVERKPVQIFSLLCDTGKRIFKSIF